VTADIEPEGNRASARPSSCEECLRLKGQGRAAVMANDRSQLADVWVVQQRHDEEVHGAAAEGGQVERVERVVGNCQHCGEVGLGTFVNDVDQGSGPGWTVVVCPSCEQDPPRPAAERPRRYSGW
jgi:hypothetical protein